MRSDSDTAGRPPRALVVLLLVITVLVMLVAFGQLGVARARQQDSGTTQTRWGPLGPADRDLLVKVRQAGLWEMPAGEMARQRTASTRVREVGTTIMVDHGRLDVEVRALAGQLGVPLPDQPTADQQTWLNEMRTAPTATEFDSVFANRLRAAHGTVFSVVAQVRAGTRNERIRAFATTANQAVLRHITLLESTGLVDHTRLPEPVLASASRASAPVSDIDPADVITVLVLVMVEVVTTIFLLGLLRNPVRQRSAGRAARGERFRDRTRQPIGQLFAKQNLVK